VLQCVAVCSNTTERLQPLCCSVLQCVTACCSVLQCDAVCCIVLQCVRLYLGSCNYYQLSPLDSRHATPHSCCLVTMSQSNGSEYSTECILYSTRLHALRLHSITCVCVRMFDCAVLCVCVCVWLCWALVVPLCCVLCVCVCVCVCDYAEPWSCHCAVSCVCVRVWVTVLCFCFFHCAVSCVCVCVCV